MASLERKLRGRACCPTRPPLTLPYEGGETVEERGQRKLRADDRVWTKQVRNLLQCVCDRIWPERCESSSGKHTPACNRM
jgi:hypothetical protein